MITQDLLTYTHLAQLRCNQQTSLHKQHDIELMPVIIFMVHVYGIKFLCWNQDYWQWWVDGFTLQTNEMPTFSDYPVTCHPKHPGLIAQICVNHMGGADHPQMKGILIMPLFIWEKFWLLSAILLPLASIYLAFLNTPNALKHTAMIK